MTHPKAAAISVVFSLATLTSVSAFAGLYSDEMAKCLVKSTSNDDRSSLVRWMFSAAALHPAVKSIASVSDAQRTELTKNTAKLFEKLLTESCKAEVQQAVKYEDPEAIGSSFQVLGQVAGRELFSDPSVAKSMADLTNYLDKQKMEKLIGSLQKIEEQGK